MVIMVKKVIDQGKMIRYENSSLLKFLTLELLLRDGKVWLLTHKHVLQLCLLRIFFFFLRFISLFFSFLFFMLLSGSTFYFFLFLFHFSRIFLLDVIHLLADRWGRKVFCKCPSVFDQSHQSSPVAITETSVLGKAKLKFFSQTAFKKGNTSWLSMQVFLCFKASCLNEVPESFRWWWPSSSPSHISGGSPDCT